MFQIDIMSRKPIYEQLSEQTERLILAGILNPMDKMPSVRSLSTELSVNPNTIQRAYTDMCAKGILCSSVGRGCFVAEEAVEIIRQNAAEKFSHLEKLVGELILAGYPKKQIIDYIDNIVPGGDMK